MTIKEYLSALGATEQDVINNLRIQRVKGIKKSNCDCPIIRGIRKYCSTPGAQYLRALAPGLLSYDDCQIMDPDCPAPVAEFMRKFDEGLYPEFEIN